MIKAFGEAGHLHQVGRSALSYWVFKGNFSGAIVCSTSGGSMLCELMWVCSRLLSAEISWNHLQIGALMKMDVWACHFLVVKGDFPQRWTCLLHRADMADVTIGTPWKPWKVRELWAQLLGSSVGVLWFFSHVWYWFWSFRIVRLITDFSLYGDLRFF